MSNHSIDQVRSACFRSDFYMDINRSIYRIVDRTENDFRCINVEDQAQEMRVGYQEFIELETSCLLVLCPIDISQF